MKNEKNNNASFVSLESQDTEKFKYNINLNVSKHFNKKFIVLKTFCNKIIQKPQLWLAEVDFIAMRNAISIWVAEAFVEGFIMNFIVWALIGLDFNLITMMAWGFVVKQTLDLYWRLRKDGTTSTILKKDK